MVKLKIQFWEQMLYRSFGQLINICSHIDYIECSVASMLVAYSC